MTRSSAWARTACALGVAALLGAAATGVTSAAFTDRALLDLGAGGTAIGDSDRFDIAVLDASGTARDAAAEADAVVLTTTGAPRFSEIAPVQMTATVVNRDTSATGDVVLAVYDPDPAADDLFGLLRFTLYLAGSTTPVIADATAQQVQDAAPALLALAPGQSRTVRVDVRLAPAAGLAAAGRTTQIGLRGAGETS